jgi:hypothetical protein
MSELLGKGVIGSFNTSAFGATDPRGLATIPDRQEELVATVTQLLSVRQMDTQL